jgi:hypothetical protein
MLPLSEDVFDEDHFAGFSFGRPAARSQPREFFAGFPRLGRCWSSGRMTPANQSFQARLIAGPGIEERPMMPFELN